MPAGARPGPLPERDPGRARARGPRPSRLAHVGRVVSWALQFISLERAEEIRTDFRQGEPFLLTRFGGPEGPFVYVAVPPERLTEVQGLVPLERITVTARVRTGASSLHRGPHRRPREPRARSVRPVGRRPRVDRRGNRRPLEWLAACNSDDTDPAPAARDGDRERRRAVRRGGRGGGLGPPRGGPLRGDRGSREGRERPLGGHAGLGDRRRVSTTITDSTGSTEIGMRMGVAPGEVRVRASVAGQGRQRRPSSSSP
jgi:hypothetical protein